MLAAHADELKLCDHLPIKLLVIHMPKKNP